jgi:hypothetical protein
MQLTRRGFTLATLGAGLARSAVGLAAGPAAESGGWAIGLPV